MKKLPYVTYAESEEWLQEDREAYYDGTENYEAVVDLRVGRGVERLDRGVTEDSVPANWRELVVEAIRAISLDMADTLSCVCAVVFRDLHYNPVNSGDRASSPYQTGLWHLGLDSGEAQYCGFEADSSFGITYGDLEEGWERYLTDNVES